jgi:hypothetical protein
VSRRGFLPFSEGSRNCVGQALALVELKAVLALLLGNFAFRCGKVLAAECRIKLPQGWLWHNGLQQYVAWEAKRLVGTLCSWCQF